MYNILMLDDDRFLLFQYFEVLKDNGFKVKMTTDLRTFYETALNETFDAIVSDINLPADNLFGDFETMAGWRTGLAACKEIRFHGSDAKLIALTNSTLPEAVEWFSQDESVAYFRKKYYPPLEFSIALKYILDNPDCIFGEFEEDNTLQKQLSDIRKDLSKQKNEILIEKLDEIIKALKSDDSKSFKSSFRDFISTFSDVASILSSLPIIKEIISLL